MVEPPNTLIFRLIEPKGDYITTKLSIDYVRGKPSERLVLPEVPNDYEGEMVQIDLYREVLGDTKTGQRFVKVTEVIVPISNRVLGFKYRTVVYELSTNYDLFL